MWTIPDKGEGSNDTQSILFQEYLDVLVAGATFTDYVISGCAVTNDGTDLVLAVAAGWVITHGVPYQISAGTATITTADATNPRLDLVVVNSSGTIAVRAGTAAAAPKPPARTAHDVVLAVVYVPANDTGIAQDQITDLRIVQPVPKSQIRMQRLISTSSGTYTPGSDVAAFAVCVAGATGGIASIAGGGGVGGGGYSEKWYKSPSGSYSYTIGAGGSTSGTDGGTTTFGTAEVSITGSGGVTGTTGSAGGVGSGGDFNASGGAGGTGIASVAAGAGSGGAGSRAGDGGTGGNAASGVGGGGGGTGGNNASGATAGGSGTLSASALQFPGLTETIDESFAGGANGSLANGGHGTAGNVYFNVSNGGVSQPTANNDTSGNTQGINGAPRAERGRNTTGNSANGRNGQITVIEYLR